MARDAALEDFVGGETIPISLAPVVVVADYLPVALGLLEVLIEGTL